MARSEGSELAFDRGVRGGYRARVQRESERCRLEIGVESVADARAAERGGADELELAAGLGVGGLTPSAGALERVLAATALPVTVLVRPRPGDFVHDADELAVMARDVEVARAAGAAGVALGVLAPDGTIDERALAELVARAGPLSVTFHRAFDLVPDPAAALETLVALGVARVQSSGGAARAFDGAARLASLVEVAASRLAIVAAGGVDGEHAAELVARTRVPWLHASAAVTRPGPLPPRDYPLASAPPPAAHERRATDLERVRALARALATRA